MITTNEQGRAVLQYEETGVIRRIPLEKRGVSKRGNEWVLGAVVLEVFSEDNRTSAQLYLSTFDTELIETINMLGVGKKVKVLFHIDAREQYDSYKINLMLDEIRGMNDKEDFTYHMNKKEEEA